MIKVIALDIYGTILATDDFENRLSPRKGTEEFFEKCSAKEIKVVAASDANSDLVKIDLQESGVKLSRFDRFYELKDAPKDFSSILEDYSIEASELLVIGDSDKDILGAKRINAKYFRVPEYKGLGDKFNLKNLEF